MQRLREHAHHLPVDGVEVLGDQSLWIDFHGVDEADVGATELGMQVGHGARDVPGTHEGRDLIGKLLRPQVAEVVCGIGGDDEDARALEHAPKCQR